MRDTFVLYSNYYDILKDTSDEDLGSLFRAILSYAKRDEVIELPFHLTLAFGFIKNQMDIDFEKYSEKVKKLKNNGRKGGLTKGKTNSETAIQVVTDNTSDLTNNLYGNKLPAVCNLSSEVEENGIFTTHEKEAGLNPDLYLHDEITTKQKMMHEISSKNNVEDNSDNMGYFTRRYMESKIRLNSC